MISFDRRFFARGGSVAIISVSAMHLYQAGLMLVWASAAGATPILEIIQAANRVGLPHGTRFVAVCLIGSALLALFGVACRLGRVRVLLLALQHLLVGIMAYGGIRASLLGRYLDGTTIPWPHIAADQAGLLALFAIHTGAILRRCWDPDG